MLGLIAALLHWLLDWLSGRKRQEQIEHGQTLERYRQAEAVIAQTMEAQKDATIIDRKPDPAVDAALDELHRLRHPEAYR